MHATTHYRLIAGLYDMQYELPTNVTKSTNLSNSNVKSIRKLNNVIHLNVVRQLYKSCIVTNTIHHISLFQAYNPTSKLSKINTKLAHELTHTRFILLAH